MAEGGLAGCGHIYQPPEEESARKRHTQHHKILGSREQKRTKRLAGCGRSLSLSLYTLHLNIISPQLCAVSYIRHWLGGGGGGGVVCFCFFFRQNQREHQNQIAHRHRSRFSSIQSRLPSRSVGMEVVRAHRGASFFFLSRSQIDLGSSLPFFSLSGLCLLLLLGRELGCIAWGLAASFVCRFHFPARGEAAVVATVNDLQRGVFSKSSGATRT